MEKYGRVDVLLNSAGLGIGGAPEEQTMEDWRKLMSVNLDAVFLGTKHLPEALAPLYVSPRSTNGSGIRPQ